jgi:predicted DNA-binding protein with PD1-like motif
VTGVLNFRFQGLYKAKNLPSAAYLRPNMQSPQKIYALRLKPGQDLKQSLSDFTKEQRIEAGYIITCVGSLSACHLRYAGQSEGVKTEGKFEILSLSGTLCGSGLHLHISLADSTGKTTGGHLLDGNLIYTTAEIVIGEAVDWHFERQMDAETGYLELVVRGK